jgi:hypothetical protein
VIRVVARELEPRQPKLLHARTPAPEVEALAAWVPRVTRLRAWRPAGWAIGLVPRSVHLKLGSPARGARGWAYGDGRVVVYCRDDAAWNLAILVHEFAHVATPHEHHGPRFRETYALAIRELTGDLIPTKRVGAKWDRDELAAQALRAMMARVSAE